MVYIRIPHLCLGKNICKSEEFSLAKNTSMHWTLDIIFNEDKGWFIKDNERENMALLKIMAMNILHMQKDEKRQVSFKEKNSLLRSMRTILKRALYIISCRCHI